MNGGIINEYFPTLTILFHYIKEGDNIINVLPMKKCTITTDGHEKVQIIFKFPIQQWNDRNSTQNHGGPPMNVFFVRRQTMSQRIDYFLYRML